MQLEILSIGKVKQSFVLSAEEEYLQRIRPFAKTKVTEIELPKLASLPDPERRRRETEEVLSRVKPGAFLIALDEDGKEFSSEDFAKFIDNFFCRSRSNCFRNVTSFKTAVIRRLPSAAGLI